WLCHVALRWPPKPRMAPASASFLLLEKRDDGFANSCVLLFVKHDGIRDDRLGIGQIGIEMLLVPDEIGFGVARRVVEAHKTTGLAAIDARQWWSLARWISRIQRMARRALLFEKIRPGRIGGSRQCHLRVTSSDAAGGEGDKSRKPRARKIFPIRHVLPITDFSAFDLMIDRCLAL